MGDPETSLVSVRRAGLAVFPGFQLVRLARTPSTQDIVRSAARRGAPEGFCCVADLQTAGRGRAGRSWVAPAGTALLASLLLRRRAETVPGLPLAAGIAVAGAINDVAGVACRLKWPNDILAGGGKLAGILIEAEPSGGSVLGIGVNLTVPEFPPGVGGSSLHRLTPASISWDTLLAAILLRLGAVLAHLEAGGIPRLRVAWTALAAGLGGPIRARVGERTVVGTATGLDDDGALLVATEEGRVKLVAGEVHLLQHPRPGRDTGEPAATETRTRKPTARTPRLRR